MDGTQAADQMQQSAAAVPPQQAPQQPQATDVNPGGQIAPVAQPQLPTVDPYQHSTAFGLAAKALLGSDTSYAVDPKTGQTVATQTPRKPGQLFKDILSAAILGGAAGASGDPRQGFAGGITRGGAAAVADQRQQDLLKRQQAQQQFQDQNAASANQRAQNADVRAGNADSRAEKESVTIDTLRKAQIAQANAETIRANVLTQGETFKVHDEIAKAGQQHFSDYKAAGLAPVMKDVSESDMKQTIANNPGASAYDWEATGIKTFIDPKTGTPQFESTYSAYNPKGQIAVSKGTIDQWKKDGLDKLRPELFNMLKPGKEVDATQYVELKRLDQQAFNDNHVRATADQETAEGKARIHLQNAEAAKNFSDAYEAKQRGDQLKLGKTQQEQFGTALKELNSVGGDFTKLSPGSKIIIGESAKSMVPGLTQEIKDAVDSGDQAHANQLMEELDNIRHLSTQVMLGTPQQTGDPRVSAAVASLKGKSPDDIEKALADPRIPEASKAAIRAGLGVTAPTPSHVDLSQPVGTAIVGGLKRFGEKMGPTNPSTDQSLFNQAASQK